MEWLGGKKGYFLHTQWIFMNNNEHAVFIFKVTGQGEGQT